MQYFGMYSQRNCRVRGGNIHRTLDGRLVITTEIWNQESSPHVFENALYPDKVNLGPIEESAIGKVHGADGDEPSAYQMIMGLPIRPTSRLGREPGLFVPMNRFVPTMQEAQQIAEAIVTQMGLPVRMPKELFLKNLQINLPPLDMERLRTLFPNDAGDIGMGVAPGIRPPGSIVP